jgi:hypothetical protein
VINAHHTFADPAMSGRKLVNLKLPCRKAECSRYWNGPRRPDAEVWAFLQAWRAGVH